jgi:hypothetical protein
MRAVAEALPAPWRDYAAAGKVQYITSLYWLSRVLQKLGRTAGS